MEYQIFISHCKNGGDALSRMLYDNLTARGYRVFMDVSSLETGRDDEKIYQALSTCTDVIVVLPPNALDRCIDSDDWVRKEIAQALLLEKRITPIMMNGFEFPSSLPDDIAAISKHHGLSYNSVSDLPWIVESLCQTRLQSKPEATAQAQDDPTAETVLTPTENPSLPPEEVTRIRAERILEVGRNIIILLFIGIVFAFPIIVWICKIDTSSFPKPIQLYANSSPLEMLGIFAVVWFLAYDIVKYTLSPKNTIDFSFFTLPPDECLMKLAAVRFVAKLICDNPPPSLHPAHFKVHHVFYGMELASLEGTTVDYFLYNLDMITTRHHFHHGYVIGIAGSRSIVIQELSEKGFLYCEMHNDILHFTKDDYHLRVSFTPSGLTVLGIEMTRGDTESILENAVRDGYMKSISHTLLHPVRTYHYVISAIKKTDDNKS